jgi:CRISPR-associated protein (TIGR02710 family)
VEKGRERVSVITPNDILADYNQRLAKQMFNAYQFDAGLNMLRDTQQRVEREDVKELELVFKAYERWDKFDHAAARRHFENVRITSKAVRDRIGPNRGFVNQLAKALAARPEHIIPEQIVDLLANAGRRAEEGKFDDAVARLYRITELLVQYRLQEGINLSVKGLKTSGLDLARLPANLRPRYDALRKPDGAIKLGLAQAFTLLGELGDQDWSDRYWNNQKLRGLLTRRNQSVLAHGLTPVERPVYAELRQEVSSLVRATIPNMAALVQRATMIKLEHL